MNKSTIDYNLPQSAGRRVSFFLALIAGLAMLFLQSYIAGVLNSVSIAQFLQVQFAWNLAGFDSSIAALGDGAKAYTTHLWWGMAYPFTYATFFFCTISLLMTPKPTGLSLLPAYRRAWALDRFRRLRALRNLRYFAVVAGLADLAENIMTLVLLSPGAPRSELMVLFCFVCTLVKWFFIAASIIAGLYALLVQYLAKHGRRG